jgi:hypothetical protein
MPRFPQRDDYGWYQADPALVILDFSWYADDHPNLRPQDYHREAGGRRQEG